MLNRVVLIGRLTRDPELRYTQNGIAVTTFRLAVERPFTNAQGEREADFINIVTWRGLAETCANYLKKGQLTAAEGRLQVRSFENNEGRTIFMTEVVADNVRFLEFSRRDDRSEQQANPNQPQAGGMGQPAATNDDPFANEGKPIDISDDDLPF